MEVESRKTQGQPAPAPATSCAECLGPAEPPVAARGGATLCGACAEGYYAPCAACGVLAPLDEAVAKDSRLVCADCDAGGAALSVAPEDVPDEATVETLVAEYVALHAEEKRVKDRLEEIKEQLKLAASVRQRVAGAVTLRGGGGAVKCGYKSALKCDDEKVAALEQRLDAEQFESLFQRSVRYAPVKENLEKLLSEAAGDLDEVRELVRAAVERTEQATLTVVRPKKGS